MAAKLWAPKWSSYNRLDGRQQHLIIFDWQAQEQHLLFRTRRECRAWIAQNFGYIKQRKDLRSEPHGWRMPKAVQVEIRECEAQ
jgi:hypothetical protein